LEKRAEQVLPESEGYGGKRWVREAGMRNDPKMYAHMNK
jgi:hypothetical protein